MYISKEERIKLKESLQNTKQLLTEGIWAFPFDVKTALKLKKFMSKPRSKEEAIDSLYYIFGDDELFDNIQDCIDPLDVRYEIRSRLKQLLQDYAKGDLKFSEILTPEAKNILDSIIFDSDLKEAIEEDSIKVGCKVKVVAGPDIYKNCTGKVDWVGDNQCVVIFDDGKPVKQNLFDCNQLEVIKANDLHEATLIEKDSSGDGVVTLDDGKEISVEVDGQLVTDPAVDNDDEEEEPTSDTPVDEYGPKLAITDMLLQAVNDENETIQYYNNLIAACNQEGFTDIANIIKHINEEENIHVGMLQYAMSTISEQAKDIDKGVEEAEKIIASGDTDIEE